MKKPNPEKNSCLIQLEWVALGCRFGAYLILAVVFFFGFLRGAWRDFYIVTAVILLRSILSFVLLQPRFRHLLGSAWNFLLYLIEFTIIFRFTGGESSPSFSMYLLLIVAHATQTDQPKRVILSTSACGAAYSSAIVYEYNTRGIYPEMFGTVVAQFLYILIGGLICYILANRFALQRQKLVQVEETANYLHNLVHQLLETLPCGILVFDEAGFILEINKAWAEFCGGTSQQFKGKTLATFADLKGSVWQVLQEHMKSGSSSHNKTVLDGYKQTRYIKLFLTEVPLQTRKYFVAVLDNVTNEFQYYVNWQDCQKELQQLIEKMQQDSNLHGQHAIRTIKQLGSPLTGLLGFIEALLAEDYGQITLDQQFVLTECRQAIHKILRILQDFRMTMPMPNE